MNGSLPHPSTRARQDWRVRAAALLLATVGLLPAPRAPAAEPEKPGAVASRVLIVSVDGLRPDLLLRADTPVLHGLMREGSFTMWAQTTDLAITLPSHMSMLTGVTPDVHGITWNDDRPFDSARFPARPTLFEVAHRAGLSTAMVAGKSKFRAFVRGGTPDRWFVPDSSAIGDRTTADSAVALIAGARPRVMLVHLAGVDAAGHARGWGSDAQLAAIAKADGAIGRILDALRGAGLFDSTVVLISADHGGSGRSHGRGDPRSRYIPWIVAGPGIRRNLDLTTDADLTVHTEDTFATVCRLLGIPIPGAIDGRPVLDILESAAGSPAVRASNPENAAGH
jgi:predicted AlkP superfamily pyrophosphatase or phosphodiesterase